MRRLVPLALVLVAGCAHDAPLPTPSFACTESPKKVAAALQRAPGEVRLEDGTLLSECVSDAQTDGDLQTLGLALTTVAEDLEADGRALELGFLIGAARRGAPGDSQIQTELVHRLERSGAAVEDVPALQEGMEAGERRG